MNIIYKNLHERILRTTVVITIGLIFCIILIQASKFMHLISSSSASIGQFLQLLSYLVVDMVANILPIAFGIAIAIVFARFKNANQLIIWRALGMPIKNLALPIFPLAICITALLLYITIILSPQALQQFKISEAEILNSITLPKHSGNLLNYNNISVFAERYSGNLVFNNLIIVDRHDKNGVFRTYKASAGLLHGKNLILNNGEIIEYNPNKIKIINTKFEKHIYDLSDIFSKYKIDFRIHEMYTQDLRFSNDIKKIAELNSRILSPFMTIILALIAFLVVLRNDYSRIASDHSLFTAMLCIVLLEGVYLGLSNACQKSQIFIPITYAFIIIGIFSCLLVINKKLQR